MELTYDSQNNSLRLTPTPPGHDPATVRVATIDGILDIGAGGRLLGVEFPSDERSLARWRNDPATSWYVTHAGDLAYIRIIDGDAGMARSTPIQLNVEYDTDDRLVAIAIPRRGVGYEISYPSGNQ